MCGKSAVKRIRTTASKANLIRKQMLGHAWYNYQFSDVDLTDFASLVWLKIFGHLHNFRCWIWIHFEKFEIRKKNYHTYIQAKNVADVRRNLIASYVKETRSQQIPSYSLCWNTNNMLMLARIFLTNSNKSKVQ